MQRFFVVVVAVFAISICTYANTQPIIFSGGGPGIATNTGVNGTHAPQTNVVLAPPHSGWSPAFTGSSWVSFLNDFATDQQGQNTCGSTDFICNGQYVLFTHTFWTSSFNNATLSVMADDTATVKVNGTEIFSAATYDPNGNNFVTCSNTKVGCLNPQTAGIQAITLLPNQLNTLTFEVHQVNGTGFGLDYAVTGDFSVPDGGMTLALLGGALLGLETLRRRFVA